MTKPAMTSRERVLAALNHRQPDRTPRLLYGELIGYTPAIADLLAARCAPQSPLDYFEMDMTGVAPHPTRLARNRFNAWLPAEAQRATGSVAGFSKSADGSSTGPVDEWGVWWRPGKFYHFAQIEPT